MRVVGLSVGAEALQVRGLDAAEVANVLEIVQVVRSHNVHGIRRKRSQASVQAIPEGSTKAHVFIAGGGDRYNAPIERHVELESGHRKRYEERINACELRVVPVGLVEQRDVRFLEGLGVVRPDDLKASLLLAVAQHIAVAAQTQVNELDSERPE